MSNHEETLYRDYKHNYKYMATIFEIWKSKFEKFYWPDHFIFI